MSKISGYTKYTCDKCGKEHYYQGDDPNSFYAGTIEIPMKDIDKNKVVEYKDFEQNEINKFIGLTATSKNIANKSNGFNYDILLGGVAKIGIDITTKDIYLCKECAEDFYDKYIEIIDFFEELGCVNND